MKTTTNIQEGDSVRIKDQKGQYIYVVDMIASTHGLVKLQGLKQIVNIKRLIKVA